LVNISQEEIIFRAIKVIFNFSGRLETIHYWHIDIHNDNIKISINNFLKGDKPILGCLYIAFL
jgi:hypothetical protein